MEVAANKIAITPPTRRKKVMIASLFFRICEIWAGNIIFMYRALVFKPDSKWIYRKLKANHVMY